MTEPNIRDLWDVLLEAHSIANAVTTDTDEQRALVKQIEDTLDNFLIEIDDEYYEFDINGDLWSEIRGG